MLGMGKLPLLSVTMPLYDLLDGPLFLPQFLTSKEGGNGTFLALILNACSQ